MPNNPLLPADILNYYQWSAQNGINPPQLPAGYVLATDPTTTGILALRLFDAAYITTGIIDPNRLGTGATGAGNLYLADDGVWKPVAGGGGGGADMYKATYDTDNSGIVDKAEALMTLGRNSTGATLYKGTVIRIQGSTGHLPNFVKAQGNNDANSAQTFGVVAADINNNSDGYVIVQGTIDTLDTRSVATHPFTDVTLADGDIVYLHPTIPGYLTNVKPLAPQHLVYVGVVTRTSPTNGTIVYRIQNGYELYELHDVAIASEVNNDLLVYESSTNLWKNKTISAIFGGTPLVSVPTLAQVTTAGNTTTNAITVGGATVNTTVNAGGIILQQNGTNIGEFRRVGNNNRGALYLINSGTTEILLETGGFSYIRSNGLGIGTATDAGYKLDVNGTARVTDNAFFNKNITVGSTTAATDNLISLLGPSNGFFRVRSLSGAVFLGLGDTLNGSQGNMFGLTRSYLNEYGNTVNGIMSTDNIPYSIRFGAFGSSTEALRITTSQITSYLKFVTTGSITAASLLAQGVYFNNTLVAAANNDVLVGLDINPTFTNGAFTGVTNYAARITGNALISNSFIQGTSATGTSVSFGMQNISPSTQFSGTLIHSQSQYLLLYSNASVSTQYSGWAPASSSGIISINTLILGSGAGEKMRIFSSGNVAINTTTDAGYKLDVNGSTRVKGVGATSATTSLLVQNSSSTTGFKVDDDGRVTVRGNIDSINNTIIFRAITNTALTLTAAQTTIGNHTAFINGFFDNLVNTDYNFRMNTSGNAIAFRDPGRVWLHTTSSGTLIQNTSFGGTAIAASALLEVQSTTKGFLQPRMTNGQVLAIATPATGLQVYDTTNNKNLLYNGTLWQNVATESWVSAQGYLTSQPWVVSGSNIYYNTGNVGIGTTTPTDKLHIVDNTNGNKFARISAGAADASAAWVAQNDLVDNIVYRVFGSGVSGTQMGVNLARSASLIANLDGTGKFLIGTYSNTDVVFGAGDQERMRLINNTGNFLIGTTVDVGTKLNVSGDINAMGYRINNVIGYTGILNIPGNPPGMQNVDIQGGIIVNIF